MRIFVSGVAGFVGAAVARAAIEAGHDVSGSVRPGGRTPPSTAGLRVVEADLRDKAAVASALADIRPDVLVHAAWSGLVGHARQSRAQLADNVEASCNLLDAGIAAGLGKFVGIGSQAEYGRLSGRISEDHVPEPSSLYGAAKLAVLHVTRQIAERAGASFAWLRLFAAYGPGDNPNWLIPSLTAQMLGGARPRTTEGVQRWDYLYIDDVARGILATVESDAAGVFNLGSGQSVPVREIVEKIRDRAAPGMEMVFGEIPYGPDQVWHMEADTARLAQAAGWTPQVSLEEGLDRTVAWVRGQRVGSVRG